MISLKVKSSWFSLLLLTLFVITPAGYSQHLQSDPTSPSIDLNSILDRVAANQSAYQRSVPSLYCTEVAHASLKSGGAVQGPDISSPGGSVPSEHTRGIENKAVISSIFRLRRLSDAGELGQFDESRIVQKVNEKAPSSPNQAIPVPDVLYGVFSNALNIFSRDGLSCFNFKLHNALKGRSITIDFSDLPQRERATDYPVFTRSSGHILIDRDSMHVVKIDRRTPRMELVPGVFGSWQWSVDYAPVVLNAETFWMPSRIISTSASEDNSEIWTFDGSYSSYHLFHSEAHIVPLSK